MSLSEGRRPRTWGRRALLGVGVLVALFAIAQIVPYGHGHSNPRVSQAVRFDSARTEQLARQACGDCHTNLTSWPWYSNVAPVSWLVTHDVSDGRERLNFSEWNRPQPDLAEVIDKVRSGDMPPLQYKLIHSAARLSDAEKGVLIAGLRRTWQQDPPPSEREGDGDSDG